MVTNRTKCLKYMIIPTNHSGVLKVTEDNLALRWNPRNNFNPIDPEQGSIILVQKYQKKKKKKKKKKKCTVQIDLIGQTAVRQMAHSLVVSDLRVETKGSRFESGCYLCAEVSSSRQSPG